LRVTRAGEPEPDNRGNQSNESGHKSPNA
jgi:hypothetical protein